MIHMNRRDILLTLAGLGILPHTALAAVASASADALPADMFGEAKPFSWEDLQKEAERLAGAPYKAPHRFTKEAQALDFDAVNTIAYRADRTLSGGIRLFPVGRYASTPVTIHIVEGKEARAVKFSPDLFTIMGDSANILGISGFRALMPNGIGDWLAFQGASYFRTAGAEHQYGLSARGIAVNVGTPEPEEFPDFTEFWIEPHDLLTYTVYALLNGPSLTGAYRFRSHYKDGVVQDVSSVLFLRKDIARLGIAPATSMFWYGEGNRAAALDWRPEIHDSDGLSMLTGRGERIWRPLLNPPFATLDSFEDENPKGFGLIQRDRNFDHYQDDSAFYERRPNLWVEPQGDWGKGAVSLFAFPTEAEIVDNIVAFWTPAAPARKGGTLRFDYRLTWNSQEAGMGDIAYAVDCWEGLAGRPGQDPVRNARKLVVDFVGKGLKGLDRSSGVTAQIDIGNGTLLLSDAYPVVTETERWRIVADVAPTIATSPANVRLYLKSVEGGAMSETFLTQVFLA
jgi:glucans biosynthesis protein